jgi:hypothetical protein
MGSRAGRERRDRHRDGRKSAIALAGLEATSPIQTSASCGFALTVARPHRWRELPERERYALIHALARYPAVEGGDRSRRLQRLHCQASAVARNGLPSARHSNCTACRPVNAAITVPVNGAVHCPAM